MLLPCRIEMLGGLSVQHAGRRIDRFQTQKTGALLAYLALQAPKPASREALAELLWPEGDATAIRNRLNQAVSSLRRQLHLPEAPPNAILVSELQLLSLNSAVVSTDVAEFEQAIQMARKATQRNDRARHLKAAIGLYRGELLEGYYEEWAVTYRLRLAEQYVEALRELVRIHSRAGEPELAADYVHQLLRVEPLDPKHHCELLELYLRADRPSSAMRHFEEFVRLFEAEGEEAPKEAWALYRRAERESRQGAPGTLPRASAAATVAAGAPISEAKASLPRAWDRFFGREAELAWLEAALADGDRLVTILGIGGSGKTRLAVETAWKVAERYANQVFFVGLSGIDAVEGIATEALRALAPGMPISDEAPFATLTRVLSGRGPALLVLDNLEHLADAAATPIATLLEKVPSLQLIGTSRQPLDLPRETQISLQPLPVPDWTERPVLAELAQNPSVALFVARAQTVRSDFQLTERTAASIVQLCRKLEGLPLAIELAAGWARTLTPSQILEQIKARSLVLESRRKDVSPRHRSMRAAIEGSYALLNPEEQQAFVRLSAFAGGWDHAAAAHLCPDLDVIGALEGLAGKSLLVVDDSGDVARFTMLEVLRSFARDQLSNDLGAEVGWLHSDYYYRQVVGTLPPAKWRAFIDRDYANVIAALDWLAANGHTGRAVEMTAALGRFWEMQGRLTEGLRWLDSLLEASEPPSAFERARLLATSGHLLWLRGDYAEAAARSDRALPNLTESPADLLLAQFTLQLEAHRTGCYDEALALLESNLRIATECGDLQSVARCWVAMGNASVELGRWDEAEAQYGRGLSAGQELGDKTRIGSAMLNLGNLAQLRGQCDVARDWLSRGLELTREAGHRWHASMALLVLSKVDAQSGELDSALARLVEAYDLAPEANLVQWRLLQQAAWVLTQLGETEAAAMLYGFVEHLMEEIRPGRHPVETASYEEHVRLLRDLIPNERLEAYWQLGRHLTAAEAADLLKSGGRRVDRP